MNFGFKMLNRFTKKDGFWKTRWEIAELMHVDVKDLQWLNRWIKDPHSRLVRNTEVDLPAVAARWLKNPKIKDRLAPTEFLVDRIVAAKRKQGGTVYLVKWKVLFLLKQ